MITVKNYKNISNDLKYKVASILFTEWKNNFVKNNINCLEQVIEKLDNIFICFVFLDQDNFIGTLSINIDTENVTFNTNYWLCNFYIEKEYRNNKKGTKILAFIENYLYKKNILILHLYCEDNVVDFYKKSKWNLSDKDKTTGMNIMIKMLEKHNNILGEFKSLQ